MWILQKMREMPLCIRVDQSCTTRFNSSPNPSQKKPNNPTSDCPNKKETRNTHRAISASPPPSPLHGHTAGTDEKIYHWICFECVCILSLPDAVATGCTEGSPPLVPPTHTASAARAGALKGALLSADSESDHYQPVNAHLKGWGEPCDPTIIVYWHCLSCRKHWMPQKKKKNISKRSLYRRLYSCAIKYLTSSTHLI